MNSNEIRRRFLKFFEERGHAVVRSSSLIPAEDPTLLFTNAGMNQFKDVFLGRENRAYTKAASSQKCVRAGGKHNDLDNVGHTRRHHTFFEMLGNFSFGDYFKEDAIVYAWELLTREFQLPAERLWVTVFREDNEAEELWARRSAVPRSRIVRMDEKDNFWQMGETGPCGPCSEIHYDFGPGTSEEGHKDCVFPCECGRYVEIWNLVFMQFDRDESGRLTPLPKPSIDTGMGLERVAAILQGKLSNFESDAIRPLIDAAAEMLNVKYGASAANDVSLRIIADHVRATTFLISDGVLPSNEGRGYVLRKIMRRGIRQGTLLGFKGPFLYSLAGVVTNHMKDAYPELLNTREYVTRVVKAEEDRFAAMAAAGLERLESVIAQVLAAGQSTIPGAEIFKLYDTFGFPLDFTKEIADEKSVALDMPGFEAELEKQRERARQTWKGDDTGVNPAFRDLAQGGTQFLGYQAHRSPGRILLLLQDGKPVERIEKPGFEGEVVLDQTPFYAESGGQVGDAGTLTTSAGTATVLDTYSPVRGVVVHKIRLEHGSLSKEEDVDARVDEGRRRQIAANHTGTHILHAVLRDVVGTHVKQAGSLVAPDRLRFDYSHFAALTDAEIREIEHRVNSVVFRNLPVQTELMDVNEAVAAGALAFFGEKYAQQVRVVSIPEVSKELCGGTHAKMTGDVGLFKILSDSGIASGIRRIEALTGFGAYSRLAEDESLLGNLSDLLRTPRHELPKAVGRVMEQHRQLEREMDALKRKSAGSLVDDLAGAAREVKGVRVIARKVEGVEGAVLRELAEQAAAKIASGVVVLAVASAGKVTLVSTVSRNLPKELHAGNIIKKVAEAVGGSGGGRPDFAQAGGKDVEKIDQALESVYTIVADLIK